MLSFTEGVWKATGDVAEGTVLLEELPTLVYPDNFPAPWKKLAKKVSKLEPDNRPSNVADTMPPWERVSLNEAIIKLLYSFDNSPTEVRDSVLQMYSDADNENDSPFDSLIRKAKVLVSKEGAKVGISKKTMGSLQEVLRVLTTRVCVTGEGDAVLYCKLGTIPHSCAPNCMFIPRGSKTGQLIAIRDISAGEVVNCSHIPTNCLRACVDTRQSWLRGIAGSRCKSACCTTGYDLRRRVICVKCHPVASRDSLTKDDQSTLCFTARNSETGKWHGLVCGSILEESEAIDLEKEKALVRKILILNETEIDVARLFQYTQAAITEAMKYFGKGHYCFQQLLLLDCGLVLHALANTSSGASITTGQKSSFTKWVKMLVDVVNFSVETSLPFSGMDELVRILLAIETLQLAQRIMTSTKREEPETIAAFETFSLLVEQSCNCLVLIEGADAVHSQDGIKLKNWWNKRYSQWMTSLTKEKEVEAVNVSTAENSFVSTTAEMSAVRDIADVSVGVEVVGSKSVLSKYKVPIMMGSAIAVSAIIGLVAMSRKSASRASVGYRGL